MPPLLKSKPSANGTTQVEKSYLSLDTECSGLDLRHGARPFLVTTCDSSGEQQFWEWEIDPLTRKPNIPASDLADINLLLFDRFLVLHNSKFDVTALTSIIPSLQWDWANTFDTLLAAHLLASNQPHDLTTCALIYLGINIKPFEDDLAIAVKEGRNLVRKKDFIEEYGEWRIANEDLPEMPSVKGTAWQNDYWLPKALCKALKYPPSHPWQTVLSKYANADSGVTLPLFQEMKKILQKRGLWKIYLSRLAQLKPIYEMESRGVTISKARTYELIKRFDKESKKAGEECLELSKGYDYDLQLPKGASPNNSLRKFIFDSMKLPVIERTEKGAPSLNKHVLEEYSITLSGKPLKFIETLMGKRKRDTSLAYLDSYLRFWTGFKGDYRLLYPSLNPTGTDTLRCSSERPNAQNVSKDGEFTLRYCFGPAPDREWWCLDYENLELRLAAYESGERVMIELFEKPDEAPYFGSNHLMNASIIYPNKFWPIANEKGKFKEVYANSYYKWIKNFDFAVQYGAMLGSGTADRAAHKVGAQALVVNRLKEHTRLNNKYITLANKYGYVETIPDKTVDPKRGYPVMCSRSEWGSISPTIPLSYHIQSTAMQCTLKSMVRCGEYLERVSRETGESYRMTMQIHDEIVFDFPKKGKKNLPIINKCRQLMEESGRDIGIPLKVSVNYHPLTWAKAA